MQLSNRVALVTGASSGIGKATALLLAREGARVGLVGRNREKLEQTADEIAAEALSEALPLTADIAEAADVERVVTELVGKWGRLDIVVANAGINGVWSPLEELTPAEWRKTIDINLTGTFLTVKYAIPALKQQGGAIVITSSVNGTRMFSNTGASAYASSKAAQMAFAQMAALELAKHRIRVNVICPGAIETRIGERTTRRNLEQVKEPVKFPAGNIPLTDGEPGTADQVAQLVLFLVSDQASHITCTPVWIDGGQSLLQG